MYAFYLNIPHEKLNTYTLIYHIEKTFSQCNIKYTSRSRSPPNGRGPMIFYGQNANFFFKFKTNFNRNMAKTRLKIIFTSTFNAFNDFIQSPRPLPPP